MSRAMFLLVNHRLLLPAILLASSSVVLAQEHSGQAMPGTLPAGSFHPEGVQEVDPLKDYHHLLAVQATQEQVAEFQQLVKSTNDAKDKLKALVANGKPEPESVAALDQVLQDVRNGNKKFQDGFSEPQKNGLRKVSKQLEKADSDLAREARRFNQIAGHGGPQAQVSAASDLDKALTDYSNEQLALGREMSIILASGQDVSFRLPEGKDLVKIGNRTITVGVSGELSQVSAEGNLRTFDLEMTADLSDLEQSITEVMRAQLDAAPACGERLAVQRATIEPASPASSLILRLHYERWSCTPMFGQASSTELAESDGSAELKLTPALDKSNALAILAEFKRIDANGMMADSLRSGDLGDDVREKVSRAVLAAVQAAADLKTSLPAAVQGGATLTGVRFQSSTGLSVLVEGKVQASNEQVELLASQLNHNSPAEKAQARPANSPPQQ